MPHTLSAKKNLRKSNKRRMANRAVIKDIAILLKKCKANAQTGTVEELRETAKLTAKKLDKAAAKHVIHANQAARKKSQVAKLLHTKEKAPKVAPPAPKK
jgi:small subunit ribosomal protein S20